MKSNKVTFNSNATVFLKILPTKITTMENIRYFRMQYTTTKFREFLQSCFSFVIAVFLKGQNRGSR
jgi:hypothetical protein